MHLPARISRQRFCHQWRPFEFTLAKANGPRDPKSTTCELIKVLAIKMRSWVRKWKNSSLIYT